MGKSRNRDDYLICFLLIVATLAVYWQVYNFGYVTHSKRIDNISKQIAAFCYEVGVLKIDENTYKIIRNE